MSEVQQMADDLHFVREAVESWQARRRPSKGMVAYWACYVIVGYTMIDVAVRWAGLFFFIGGLLGGMLSWLLARRCQRRQGVIDRSRGGAQAARGMGSFFVAYLAAVGLAITLHLSPIGGSQIFVVLIGMMYFLSGLYGPPSMRYMLVGGPLVMAGGVCVSLVPHLGWTCLGLLIASCIAVPMLARTREPHVSK